jgi:exoribonuclease R
MAICRLISPSWLRGSLPPKRVAGRRVDPPEQEVVALGQGRYALAYRPLLLSERRNAALSLATNLAVAQALLAHGTGLFRVMAGPDDKAVARLRQTALALALDWPAAMPLAQFEKTLDPAQPRQAAFMMAVRRAGNGAGYAPLSRACRRGTAPSRPPMSTPPRPCGGWPTAT